MTILPQLVNISPKKVMFPPKYVDLRALSSNVASRIYAFFVVKSTSVPKLLPQPLPYHIFYIRIVSVNFYFEFGNLIILFSHLKCAAFFYEL